MEPLREFPINAASYQLAEGMGTIPSQPLAHQHLTCDTGDELCHRAGGVLGLSPTSQFLVGDLPPSPMSIGSLLSYYGNDNSLEENSGTDDPLYTGFEDKGSETDGTEFSGASTNVVGSFFLAPAHLADIEPT